MLKTKKFLSTILAVLMLLSCASFAVSAEEPLEIKLGETISVDAPYDDGAYTYVKFVPAKSGTYTLISVSDESDPKCYLLDAELNFILDDDGYEIYADDNYEYSGNDLNFELTYTFEAGKVYYFALCDIDGDYTWDITLSCDHKYVDGKCSVCGKEYDEIKVGETISVDAPYDDGAYTYVKFVPAKSGTYTLISVSDESDPKCYLLDAELNFILDDDGYEIYADDNYEYSGNDLNFELTYTFEAGKVYYFALCDIDGDYTWDITLLCDHKFIDGKCSVCGLICDHTEINAAGGCPCGKKYNGIDIKAGETLSVDAPAKFDENNYPTNDCAYVRFVPAVSGTYILTSESDEDDPICYLLDANLIDIYDDDGEEIYADDNYEYSGNNSNFELIYTFEAGKVYYFELCEYRDNCTWDITLKTAPYVDADGEEHEVTVDYGKKATCTEDGISAGLYCADCDEYMTGHEKVAATGHNDKNADGKCDNCDYAYGCDYCGRVHPTFIQELFCKITEFFVTLFTFFGLW